MRNKYLLLLSAVFLLAIGAQAQSLGEIARQQQQKNKQDSAKSASTAKKIYTNEDMPKSSSTTPPPAAAADKPQAKKPTKAHERPEPEEKLSAEELKEKIQEQKDAIAALQHEIDKVQS